jgi:hypothetical protein
MTLTGYLESLGDRISDEESKLDTGSLESCLQNALNEYSGIRIRRLVDELTADGTAFLTLPTEWDENFSNVLQLDELDSEEHPTEVPSSEFLIIRNPAPEAQILLFVESTPTAGTIYRLTYSVLHEVDGSTDTVLDRDREAVLDLAASYACLRLAAAYIQAEDQQIQTVTLQYQTKPGEYRKLAAEYRKAFSAAMGSGSDAVKSPAGRFKSWERERELLFHS